MPTSCSCSHGWNIISKRRPVNWSPKEGQIYSIGRQGQYTSLPDPTNIHFKKKLALLTESGGADFNLIVRYYDYRNMIAHGGTIAGFTALISMTNVFNYKKRFYKQLKRL